MPETFDTEWLADHINSRCGTHYGRSQMRILLRSLAKDGVIEKGRGHFYNFSGPDDLGVQAVIEAVKNGRLDQLKKERIDGLVKKQGKAGPKKVKEAKAPVEKTKTPLPRPPVARSGGYVWRDPRRKTAARAYTTQS